ncbi:MAG: DivIVA domain-containing protein [Candidatus Rokubacteria bacterium]|nr:DivIVA domain-containing protein [Candidatus Rokubacteria bacterium]
MRISPMDIRQQQFTVRFRGFDRQEVDAFLADVAEDYEQLVKENALLKEQLTALEERSRGIEEREKLLQDTLVTTQRLAEEMKEGAKREANLLVREAELQGDKLLEEARAEEAKIKAEVLALKRTRRQLAEGLRVTLDMYQRLVAEEFGDAGAGSH